MVVGAVSCLALCKLEGAQRMRDVLYRVDDAVGVVVRGVDAPGIAGLRMRVVQDAVRGEVPHGGVLRVEVALDAQKGLALIVASSAHLLKVNEVLVDRTLAVWRRRTLGQLALLRRRQPSPVVLPKEVAARLDLGGGLMTHEGTTHADQLERELVQLLKIVGRVGDASGLVAKPRDVVQDRVDKLLLLRLRVGVVEAHHRLTTLSAILPDPCLSKVEVHRLCVSNVQVSIGLRREPRAECAAGHFEVSRQCRSEV
mmetsp:Transcript_84364/g.168434  ORF Transcript_84364/g.168434 Transcript_84364/m.168434 type:complete len:255 (+) Transcript_84364:677-1441(+)